MRYHAFPIVPRATFAPLTLLAFLATGCGKVPAEVTTAAPATDGVSQEAGGLTPPSHAVAEAAPSNRGRQEDGPLPAPLGDAPAQPSAKVEPASAIVEPEASPTSVPAPKPQPVELAAAPETLSTAVRVGSTAATAPPQPFQFRDDELGKLESERLPPPRTVPLPAVPWVSAPTARPAQFPEATDRQIWTFGVAAPSGESRSLPIEHPAIGRVLPTLDRPLPPEFTTALVPQQPEFPIGGRTRYITPNPEDVPPLAATLTLFDPKPQIQDDPSAASAWKSLLAPLAFAEPLAPAPERLTILDPFDYLRHVQVKVPLADAHAPSVSYERPAPVLMPVDK